MELRDRSSCEVTVELYSYTTVTYDHVQSGYPQSKFVRCELMEDGEAEITVKIVKELQSIRITLKELWVKSTVHVFRHVLMQE